MRAVILHQHKVAVTARHDEREERRLQILMGEISCRNMSFDVVDGN